MEPNLGWVSGWRFHCLKPFLMSGAQILMTNVSRPLEVLSPTVPLLCVGMGQVNSGELKKGSTSQSILATPGSFLMVEPLWSGCGCECVSDQDRPVLQVGKQEDPGSAP